MDNEVIRPYFNAGVLATRPDTQLLSCWRDLSLSKFNDADLKEFYKHSDAYAIFIHQAFLSAVIMKKFHQEQMKELPIDYNYPSHLFDEDVTENKPQRMDAMVTFRHEGFYRDPEWKNKMPASDDLLNWLETQLNNS